MNEEAALLRAICENPDDDTPRLVFADWLQERGDAVSNAWAEAIRAEVARAAGARGVPESRFLQSEPGIDYISTRLGVPAELNARQWERGFPTCLDGQFVRVSAAWSRLLTRTPFRRLRMVMQDGGDSTVSELVTWPGIDRLTDINLQSWRGGYWPDYFGETALLVLAACPALSGLVSLVFNGVRLTDTGVNAVLASPHLRGLKVLQFHRAFGPGDLTRRTRRRLDSRFGPNAIV